MADNCEQVRKELVKATKKVTEWRNDALRQFDQAISAAEELLQSIDEEEMISEERLTSLESSVRRMTEDITSSHKKYHPDVSKVGKSIDKNFMADFACTCTPGVFDGQNKKLLNQCIYDHFLRQSRIDINHVFCQEAQLEESKVIPPYVEIHSILEALHHHDVQPALEWISGREDSLSSVEKQVTVLKFKLMRLHFLNILPGDLDEVLAFCRQFNQFTSSDIQADVRRLMGCLMYRHRLAHSPYSSLLSEGLWDEARTSFRRIACELMDLPLDSPLATCIYAGCKALPPIVDMHLTMHKAQNSKVGKMDTELMTDIDLGDRCLYHSAFSCPVMRRELDTPMRLKCGHVISQEAQAALRQGSRIKCPYCPCDMQCSDVMHLYI